MSFAWIATDNATVPLRSYGYGYSLTLDGPPILVDALARASDKARSGSTSISATPGTLSVAVENPDHAYVVAGYGTADVWVRSLQNTTMFLDHAVYYLEGIVETSQILPAAAMTVERGALENAGFVPAPLHVSTGFELRGTMTLKQGRAM